MHWVQGKDPLPVLGFCPLVEHIVGTRRRTDQPEQRPHVDLAVGQAQHRGDVAQPFRVRDVHLGPGEAQVPERTVPAEDVLVRPGGARLWACAECRKLRPRQRCPRGDAQSLVHINCRRQVRGCTGLAHRGRERPEVMVDRALVSRAAAYHRPLAGMW